MTSDRNLVNAQHGGGGRLMESLIKDVFLKNISMKKVSGGVGLSEMDDAAVIPLGGKNLVYTTDSYTVNPLFFPGGDIGKLAVSGTVNDLAAMGARPVALASAFVIREGFEFQNLVKIVKSMDKVSREVKVPIVAGDTKVVDEGGVELIITTTGLGVADKLMLDSGVQDGDKLIITGSVGDHGIALLSYREGLKFKTKLKSDCSPLWNLIKNILPHRIHAMKDPTRGGLANALNEFSAKSKIGLVVWEEEIPVKKEVKAASEMLGIDPLTVANEGKMLVGVDERDAEKVLNVLKKHRLGRNAQIIGEATKKCGGVVVETVVGGRRVLEKPLGDPVPRVC